MTQNIRAHSRNYCCCREAISITFYECVSVFFSYLTSMESALLYCHMSLLWLLTPHPVQCSGHGRVELYLYSPCGAYSLSACTRVHLSQWFTDFIACGPLSGQKNNHESSHPRSCKEKFRMIGIENKKISLRTYFRLLRIHTRTYVTKKWMV